MVLGHPAGTSSRMDVAHRLVPQAEAGRAPANGQPMDGQHVAKRFEQRGERKVEALTRPSLDQGFDIGSVSVSFFCQPLIFCAAFCE